MLVVILLLLLLLFVVAAAVVVAAAAVMTTVAVRVIIIITTTTISIINDVTAQSFMAVKSCYIFFRDAMTSSAFLCFISLVTDGHFYILPASPPVFFCQWHWNSATLCPQNALQVDYFPFINISCYLFQCCTF